MVRTRFFRRRALRVAVPSLVLCGVLAGVALFGGSAAHATACGPSTPLATCDTAGSIALTAGALTLSAPASLAFPTTALTGALLNVRDNTANDDKYIVNDATGTALGWNVTATAATPFTCTTSGTCGTDTLGAFTTNGSTTAPGDTTKPTQACTSSGCTLPTNNTTYPVAITATAAKIYGAAAATGVGSTSISNAEWWLVIPANAKAGPYATTVTLAVTSGP